MPKLNTIKEQILSLQNSEGPSFEFDKLSLGADIEKFDNEHSSLMLKIITILGAFIGSSFMLSFVFALKLFQEPVSMIILGFGLIVTAIALSNTSKLLIFETSFIAFLIYGGILLGIGLHDYKLNASLNCLCFFLIGLLIFQFSKNEIQILLGVIASLVSIFWAIHFQKLFWLYHVYNILLTFGLLNVYLKEAQLITNPYFAKRYNALKNGLIIIFLMSMARVSIKDLNNHEIPYNWISAIGPILAVIYILGIVLDKFAIQNKSTKLLIQCITVLTLVLTIVFPAISASIVIILLCFLVNYKTGFIIGSLSLCYFICQFYYDLSFSLLVKSELLFVSGLLFAAVYFFSSKKLVENEKI
jgi:hypothetical protein